MRLVGWGKRSSMGVLAACALVPAVIAAGCGRGGSSESNAAATVKKVSSGPTEASLRSVGDSGVTGRVVYVKPPSGVLLVKIRLQGVHKATGEAQYFIWQLASRHKMTSFASYHVPHGSRLRVNLEPSPELLGWLEEGSKTQILITRVENDDRFFASQAHWSSAEDPTEIGVPVARGAFTGRLVGQSAG